MDRPILGGIILIIVTVAAVAGMMVYYSLNPNISRVNNAIINNTDQARNDTSDYKDVLPSPNIQFTISPYTADIYPIPSPSPGPAPNPMDHIIDLFDAYLKSIFPQSVVPGSAVVIVQNGKVIYMNCLGVRDLGSLAPVTFNTLFEVGSTTKQFTATNIAQLVDAGLMSWDDPISKYYPNTDKFQLYSDYVTSNITIRDCLLHHSGLPTFGGDSNVQIFNYSYPYALHQLRYLEKQYSVPQYLAVQ